MNTNAFIENQRSILQTYYPDENLDQLLECHKSALQHLTSSLNPSIFDGNTQSLEINCTYLLPGFFSETIHPIAHLSDSLFLALYYFVSQQKESMDNNPSLHPEYDNLNTLVENLGPIWKKGFKFSAVDITSYLKIWNSLKSWVNNLDVHKPDLNFNFHLLVYLKLALYFLEKKLPKASSGFTFNPQQILINNIYHNILEIGNILTSKFERLEKERSNEELKRASSDAVKGDNEEQPDIFVDALMYPIENIIIDLNSLLDNLNPKNLTNSQSITINNENELLTWIDSKDPNLLKSLETIIGHINQLEEIGEDVSGYKERFNLLAHELFIELSKNTHTKFTLPRELDDIRKSITQAINSSSKNPRQILEQMNKFLKKVESFSFFSLTWLSHIWLYVTSSAYRATYKDLKRTVTNSQMNDQQKIDQLVLDFLKIKGSKDFKDLKGFFPLTDNNNNNTNNSEDTNSNRYRKP